MKRFAALVILGFPYLLNAQQITLPPSSVQDGVIIQAAGINVGASYWGDKNGLGAYRIAGDGYQRPLRPGVADNQLGFTWQATAPTSFTSASQNISQKGGIVRVIFIGETAGWLNDFGYTYNGNPTGSESYTAWSRMQSFGSNPNIKFGDYFDLTLAPAAMSSLDFWFSANEGTHQASSGNPKNGGLYTLFHSPSVAGQSSQFLWANGSLAVSTWFPSLNESMLINTYLISMEDWRLGRGADRDYNDFQFAMQFLNVDTQAAIPEPGQYAAIAGIAALLGALWQKRRRIAQV